jgi:ABC-2 type transport system permease protein
VDPAAKLTATAVLSLLQAAAFVAVAWRSRHGAAGDRLAHGAVLLAAVCVALMLGALGLLLSVHIRSWRTSPAR